MTTDPASDDESDMIDSLFRAEGCMDRSSITFRRDAIRGAIAEALIKRDGERLARARALAPVAAVRVPDLLDGRVFVAAYASCITEASPQQTVQLIGTTPASPEERAAMTAFGAILMDCMAHDARYRMNITDLRNHMALELFRLSEAPNA